MAMDQNYNQFAVSDLLKSPGDVLKQSIPEATPYQLPISGPGNITFPSGYGVKKAESPIASAMEKFYNSTPSERFQATPIKYNAADINAARYMSSPDYYKLGISLYGDNEERYGQNQSWGEVLSNGFAGAGRLAANGFVDTWKGWGRMIDALGHWDWDRLKGDAQSMMELDKAMNDAMNDNPIYATQEGTDTFWNRQTFGNFLQQGGFTFGALAATASEWVVTKAIEAGLAATGVGAGAAVGLEAAEEVKTAASLGRIGRMFQKTKEFYDAAKNTKALKKLGDIWKEESVIKNVFSKVGQKIPGVDIGMEMYQAGKTGLEAGLSGTKIASDIARVGVGGLKRTMSEANFAFTEARMEAAGTFSDLYSQMQQQYYTDHGVYATGSELQKMQNLSMEAANKNFNFNSAVLAISNRIQFDNIFKGSKVLSKILSKFGDDAVEGAEDILRVTGKVNGRNTIQYYTDGILSNYKKISETFGKTKALTVTTKSILKPILQFEATEGIQELLQEGSNNYYKDYYLDLYRSTYNPEIQASSERSLNKAIESQKNMQGLKTFASGALTGMMIHGPVSLGFKMLKKANIKIKDSYAAAGLTGEKRDELLAKRKEARESYKGYYAQFNAIAKDPSKFFPEAIKNFNIQKEGALALDEAAKAGDKFAYENIRTDMLHSTMTQAYRNNTHEALIDTLREYGKHMTKEEFEQAFVGVDYTSENKKTVQDYTDRIANSLESYVKSRKKLDEKFSNYANPNRYEFGSKKWFDESYKKKVLDDMLDVLAGNEFKATDALNRSIELFAKASNHKSLGSSLAVSYNILGSENNMKKEIAVLNDEISTKKQQLTAENISEEVKKTLQSEIELKEKQKEYIQDWLENKDELIDKVKVNKSYNAFKQYLELKNKESGKEFTVNSNEVEDFYLQLLDYIKLNKKAQNHVDAINMLSNPTYFEQIHKRMVQGARLAYLELAHEAAAEYIKQKGGVPENEHFILEVSGQFGIFNPNGVLISLADDEDEAEKIKEELDEKVYGKKKPKKEDKKSIEIEVKDKEEKPHKITLVEGDEYITESNPTKRVMPKSGKVITTYDQDIIKINSLDLDNNTLTITINNSGESVTYTLDEFSELSGKLWNLSEMDKDAALFFRNRDRVIVIKVNKDNGLLHRIDGVHAKKDYSSNSQEVYAMIKYDIDTNDPSKTKKILYFDYKTKDGKSHRVPFDINYYNKYGVKTDQKYLLKVAPTVEEYLKQQSEKRKLDIYNKQIEIFELLIKEQEKKSGPREQRKLEINKQIDQINKDLDEAEEYVKLANKEINDIVSSKKKISQKQKREIASLKQLANEYTQKLNSLKETLSLLNAEKLEIENELKVLNEVSESYYLALDEIKKTETPYLRGGTSQTIYGEEQDKLNQIEQERPVSYVPVDDFERVLNSLNLEKNDIENKLKIVEDTIKRVEKLISRFTKYDDIINVIIGTDPTSNKSKKELQTALVKLKLKEQDKQEPDKEKIELINNLLSGLNTRLKGFDNQVFGKEILEAISFVNLFSIATQEKQKLQDQLNFVSKEIEDISEGKEYNDKNIIPLKQKIEYLKNIEKVLLEGQAKLEALNLIEKTKTSVKAPTTEAAEQFAGYDDIMSYEEVISLDGGKDDIILVDHDKVKFINALFKTAGRHYENSTAQKDNKALTPEQDRFFTFTSNSIIANQNYFLIPITEDNDKYGIIQKSYINEQGNTVEVKDDVKLIVAKKVAGKYIPVDKYGNVLTEDQQTKDNLVFNSMVNNVELMQDDVDAAIKWLKSDANKTFTITKNKIGANGIVTKEEYTDEELKNELNAFKKFRSNIIKNIKDGIGVDPLKVEKKSIGKQRREVLDVTTGRPQELELQGRLIEEDPDFSVRGELKHPDGNPIELRVSTKDSGISSTIKQGRMVMQKGDTFYQVYNRRINENEINNIFDVILTILPMFGRRNISKERIDKLKELYDQGVITLDRLTELTKKLSPEEEKQFDLGLRYLLHTIYWSQVKEGGKIGNKQFYIKGDSLYVGEKAYKFEIDGKINLQNIIDSKDEIMNIIERDSEDNIISQEPMFHAVNSGSIKKKDQQFITVKVVDGVIVKDKEYKNYLEYLLSNKDGRTPIVYTNIVKYNKDEPQLANSYLIYSRPHEEISVPPRPKEEESETSTTREEEKLGFTNIKPNSKISITRKMKNNVLLELQGIWDGKNFTIEKAIRLTDNEDRTSILKENGALKTIEDELNENINDLITIKNDISNLERANKIKLENKIIPTIEEQDTLTKQKNLYLDIHKNLSETYSDIKYIKEKDNTQLKSDIETLIRMGKIEYVDDTTNAKC